MSSSLRNAVKRKTHKERSQLSHRKKLGLLEKKSDYVQRAKDYHKKEDAIKKLQEKAALRNPDEFHFAMQSAKTKDGLHVVETAEANKYTQDQLQLMRTQDVGYVNLKAQAEAQKIEKMKANLHRIGSTKRNKHTVFVEDENELKAFDPSKHFDTPEPLLRRTYNRPRSQQLEENRGMSKREKLESKLQVKKTNRMKRAAYRELKQRTHRHNKLVAVRDRLSLKKELAGRGSKRKIRLYDEDTGDVQIVYKWKKERKR
eukprot:jgi/Pico_ML_1/52789/g3444.t2